MNSRDKTLLVIAHLSMFLARTGFGLLIPLVIYLNSGNVLGRSLKENSLDILKFQAKITFTYLAMQFLGILYQIIVNFTPSPTLTQLTFSPFNPLTILSIASQVVLTGGIVFAIFGAILVASNKDFRYPRFWIGR